MDEDLNERSMMLDRDAAQLRITVETLFPEQPWILRRFDNVVEWLKSCLLNNWNGP